MRLLLLFLLICSYGFGQTNQKIIPNTNRLKVSETIPTIVFPTLDNQTLIAEEQLNRTNKTGRYMFGHEHQTNINFITESKQIEIENGTLFLLSLKSENALSMNIIFNEFYLPEQSYLHVYNKNKTTIVGAYTSKNNNVNNVLGTDLVKGEEIIIEYFEPKLTLEKAQLNINMVVHGFEDINNWYGNTKVNESGACNLDVICPDGIPWANEIRSVARISIGGGLCSGSLVNNTAQDGKAYFLTANHCGPQSMAGAVFRFNYDSPICGSQTSANSQNAVVNHTINGSSLKSRSTRSDFGLIELNSIPPENYNVYYAGWNNAGDIPETTAGIHHPSGDVKKLAFDDDAPVSGTFGNSIANGEWRIIRWDRNTTTEGGSSGSGLWDENHLIVGQLHGGAANCANSVNDYYGKFSVSWDGTSATNRLKDWLDPQNTGVTSLEGFDPNASNLDINLINIVTPDSITCGKTITSRILVRNDGEENLTSLTFNYNLNGIVENFNWSGTLETGDTTIIALPSLNTVIEGNNTLEITVSNPNNETDGNIENNNLTYNFLNNQNCFAYPNPFTNQLTINFEQEKTNGKPVSILITDIQGKQIWSATNNESTNTSVEINTSQIAAGNYLLHIVYENESTVQKIVKVY